MCRTFYPDTFQRISLLVEPQLLSDILSECKVVVLNENHGIQTVEDRCAPYKIIAVYAGYVAVSLSGEAETSKDRFNLYAARLVSADSLLPNGSPNGSDPTISIRAETLIYIPERGRIMTNVVANDEIHFGIQLNFAKTGTYDFKTVMETAPMPNGELFALLKKTIMARTKPCKFRSPSGIHRTSIRISDGIHERLKSHPFLAPNQLEVI